MIKGSKAALEALQAADDAASELPAPSSRWFGGRLENYCGACGHHPVEGPETRYRCPSCGLTADEYPCITRHAHGIDPGEGYPETEAALAVLEQAKSGRLDVADSSVAWELAGMATERTHNGEGGDVDSIDNHRSRPRT